MVSKGGIYRIWIYELKAQPKEQSETDLREYSMRIYFQQGEVDPIRYLFGVFKRIAPNADVLADPLNGCLFIEHAKDKASTIRASFSVNGYIGGIIEIEPHWLPLRTAKKYLAAMAKEIKGDFPGAVVEGIQVN